MIGRQDKWLFCYSKSFIINHLRYLVRLRPYIQVRASWSGDVASPVNDSNFTVLFQNPVGFVQKVLR